MSSKSLVTCHGRSSTHGRTQLKQTASRTQTVLDSSIGKPAQSIKVHLFTSPGTTEIGSINILTRNITWIPLGTSTTDADGRCLNLLSVPSIGNPSDPTRPTTPPTLQPGIYQIVFETKEYFDRSGRSSFYPFVQVRSPPTTDSLSRDAALIERLPFSG